MRLNWLPHTGDSMPLGVSRGTPLFYTLVGDLPDRHYRGLAGDVCWGPGLGPNGEGRIEKYAAVSVAPSVAEQAAEAVRVEVEDTPTPGRSFKLGESTAFVFVGEVEVDDPVGNATRAFNELTGNDLSEADGRVFAKLIDMAHLGDAP